MTTFKFQLRFKLAPTAFIAENTESILLTLPNAPQVLFQSRPARSLNETELIDAISEGFLSLDAAIDYGRRVRDTITITCALLGKGIEVTKYEEFFDQKNIKESTSGQAYIQPNSIDGLIVYPQAAKIEYRGWELSAKAGTHAEHFRQVFSRSFDLTENLNGRLSLAFELYNSHHFEVSLKARFLQLISVIECLADRQQKKDVIVAHVRELVEISKEQLIPTEDISQEDINDFISRLSDLKRESITNACRNLVRKHLGDNESATFKECYDIRSKLAHTGVIPKGTDLFAHYSKLDYIVRLLLHSLVSRQAT